MNLLFIQIAQNKTIIKGISRRIIDFINYKNIKENADPMSIMIENMTIYNSLTNLENNYI